MKMKITIIILVILLLVGFRVRQHKPTSEMENSTYVIGTHLFTRKIALTDDRIATAKKGKKLTIYYKNYKGEWIDARSGESIDVPRYFRITHIDTERVR